MHLLPLAALRSDREHLVVALHHLCYLKEFVRPDDLYRYGVMFVIVKSV
jgi:hypothetical protein